MGSMTDTVQHVSRRGKLTLCGLYVHSLVEGHYVDNANPTCQWCLYARERLREYKMKTEQRQCGNCRFWKNYTSASDKGVCIRFPPTVLKNHPFGVFPPTTCDTECGEHQWKDSERPASHDEFASQMGRAARCQQIIDLVAVQEFSPSDAHQLINMIKLRTRGEFTK